MKNRSLNQLFKMRDALEILITHYPSGEDWMDLKRMRETVQDELEGRVKHGR